MKCVLPHLCNRKRKRRWPKEFSLVLICTTANSARQHSCSIHLHTHTHTHTHPERQTERERQRERQRETKKEVAIKPLSQEIEGRNGRYGCCSCSCFLCRDIKRGRWKEEEYQVCKEHRYFVLKRYTLEYFKSSKGGKPGFTWDLRSRNFLLWRLWTQLHEANNGKGYPGLCEDR